MNEIAKVLIERSGHHMVILLIVSLIDFLLSVTVSGIQPVLSDAFLNFGQLSLLLALLAGVFLPTLLWSLTGTADRIGMASERWVRQKIELREEYALVPGEKILIPPSPCYIEMQSLGELRGRVHYVVITNKRILVGRYSGLPPLFDDVGFLSFWSADSGVVDMNNYFEDTSRIKFPLLVLNYYTASPLFRVKLDLGIARTVFEESQGYPSVKIGYGPLITIYHPQSKRICDLFRPSKEPPF